MISILLRRLYLRLSYRTGLSRDFRPGMQARIPLSFSAEPVGVVATVGDQPVGEGQAAHHRASADVV